ncbi:MAG: sulfatase, partial [Acidobacteria bacterium]|nr:sulfatase [Acidobacteriota bacterium]
IHGYQRHTSPFLDSLASQGVVFEWAFAEKPRTSPSIASILTGTYPRRHGIHNTYEVLAPEHLTLAEVLRDAGYETGAVVTNANLYPVYGFDQGFRRYVYGAHDARQQTDRALAWLEAKPAEPFFLWVHYIDPHRPYSPPAPYDRLYLMDQRGSGEDRAQAGLSRRVSARSRGSDVEGSGSRIDWQIVEPEMDFTHHIARYDGEIRYTDDAIRKLSETFERRGVLDRTLLVFTADHGESFGEQGIFGHGPTAHDSNARIPLFFRFPGRLAAGLRVQAVVGGVSISPTILDLLGLPRPPTVQGESLAGWMQAHATHPADTFAVTEAGMGPHIHRGIQQSLRTR